MLQGETSVGKTSLITYLAGRVGQVCHRINNHEHTDLQTYLGAYTAASATGTAETSDSASVPLVFQEGIFVQAMRKGHWIILDELNLAPTEILEALNRVSLVFMLIGCRLTCLTRTLDRFRIQIAYTIPARCAVRRSTLTASFPILRFLGFVVMIQQFDFIIATPMHSMGSKPCS